MAKKLRDSLVAEGFEDDKRHEDRCGRIIEIA